MQSDWSAMKRLIWLRGNPATGGGGGSPLTVSGPTPLLMPGALAKPMRAATFAISPVQAGSGDPSPQNVRAITGHSSMTALVSGKNLLEMWSWENTAYNPTVGTKISPLKRTTNSFIDNGDGTFTVTLTNAWASRSFVVPVVPGASYHIKLRRAGTAGTRSSNYFVDGTFTVISNPSNSLNTDETFNENFTAPDGAAYFVYSMTSNTANTTITIYYPQLEVGNEATPYTPYSGTTVSVEFPALGKNLFGGITSGKSSDSTRDGVSFTNNPDGSVTIKGTSTASRWYNFGNVTLPPGTFTASLRIEGTYTGTLYFGATDGAFKTYPNVNTYPRTVTAQSETTGNFGLNAPTGFSSPDGITVWPQIETESTATAYEPYTNTVYSGTIDPVTGEGVVTHVKADMSVAVWSAHASLANVFTGYTNNPSFKRWKQIPNGGVANAYCNKYKVVTSAAGGADATDYSIAIGTGGSYNIYIHDSTYSNVNDFKNSLQSIDLVYELATPIPFTIPPQSLTPPAGDAYIWADCGGSAEVTYIGKP